MLSTTLALQLVAFASVVVVASPIPVPAVVEDRALLGGVLGGGGGLLGGAGGGALGGLGGGGLLGGAGGGALLGGGDGTLGAGALLNGGPNGGGLLALGGSNAGPYYGGSYGGGGFPLEKKGFFNGADLIGSGGNPVLSGDNNDLLSAVGGGSGLLGGSGGLLGGTNSLTRIISPRTPGLPLLGSGLGGGSPLSSLGGGHDLLSNGNGLLGVGAPKGLLGTGLLAGGYQWTAPNGWVRPSWYEFGYFHPDSGSWIYDQTQVLAYIAQVGFVQLGTSPSSSYYLLFPTGPTWTHPVRTLNLSRRSQYGYWDQANNFISVEVDVRNLLGSCGWDRPY